MNRELLEEVLTSDNLAQAWKRVKANKGALGIDGMTIEDFPKHARAHWPAIRKQIKEGQYQPQAVRRVEIPKPGGGKRMLGIPTVIQQAVAQVLTSIFDPTFSQSSFGVRPGRNAHQAIRQVQATVQEGRTIAVDIDLAKFFDTVNHDVLMNLLARSIADKRLLRLIGCYGACRRSGHWQQRLLGFAQSAPRWLAGVDTRGDAASRKSH